MHRHLCSYCRAVITLDDGGKCQTNVDHEDGLCEACALTQPGLGEMGRDERRAYDEDGVT
jgi:hypothetical protein